jgi:tetratricopeptide (TPR) repeat protein
MHAPPPADHEKPVEATTPAGAAGSVGATGGTAVVPRLLRRRRLWIAGVLLGLAAAALAAVSPSLRAWYHRRAAHSELGPSSPEDRTTESAWYHFHAARAELQRYHNPQAIRHLRICRDAWPNDPDVLLLAARAARRARVYSDTQRLLQMYQQSQGRDEAVALEQFLLSAECRVDQVADLCWRYVEEGRFDVPLLLEALTRGYLRQYRLGKARLCLDRWRQLQPENPQALYLEGLYLLDYLHAPSAAVDSYRRALELDPDHDEARLGLAVALLGDKRFAQAAEHFERLRQSQPDNSRVQVGLAECLDGLGETAEAVRRVDDVLARQPESAAALSLRGQLALKSGPLAEAESRLRQALRCNSMDHRARYSLVLCLQRTGQEEEARREQRQLQRMEQDVARFHEIVTKEIAQRPTDPALHCTLGQLLLRGGQPEEGVRWLQSALRLDPQYAPARQALADYLRRVKVESRPGSP